MGTSSRLGRRFLATIDRCPGLSVVSVFSCGFLLTVVSSALHSHVVQSWPLAPVVSSAWQSHVAQLWPLASCSISVCCAVAFGARWYDRQQNDRL